MRRIRTLTRKDIAMAKKPAERQAIKRSDIVILVLCLLSIVSFVWCVFYVQEVIIDIKIPLLLGSLCGIIGILFTKKRENYFYAFIGYGSMFVGLPFFINKTFADRETSIVKLPIIEKHYSAGKHGPSVDVKYGDINKEINVGTDSELERSEYIQLTINKGALGIYIIREHCLLKQ